MLQISPAKKLADGLRQAASHRSLFVCPSKAFFESDDWMNVESDSVFIRLMDTSFLYDLHSVAESCACTHIYVWGLLEAIDLEDLPSVIGLLSSFQSLLGCGRLQRISLFADVDLLTDEFRRELLRWIPSAGE
ncbi:MAG: uncharacterized protein KVP18_002200 [Porospora cf. gigantea A]|uniref:uncharacterized protein n=1 Tax=Porospora cf. gigantea A TaxID=2853593 RepID=UPI00355ABB90|nr:MAG: hypothetical protein KVP18_002200 [Porospora cf. gigantea A]